MEAAPRFDTRPDIRDRYLDLLESSLSNAIYGESRWEMFLRLALQRIRHPYLTRRGAFGWPARAHTMIGQARLRNLRNLVERTLLEGVPGDYIETGVWRGGACILIRGVLAAHGVVNRRVFVADTFEGLPRPNAARYPADMRDRLFVFEELAVSKEQVRSNFARYNLLDQQVVFLKGLFSETLPGLAGDSFALIRLDGDMYESTMDSLTNLYDRLSRGGFAIVDDYGGIKACKTAVDDFLGARGLQPQINAIDDSCVWWRKD